jgi:murein DD-endopeptidase MepM/ murein hydrolase activator NlpD
MANIILSARGRITTYFRQDIGRGFLHNGIDQGHGNGTAWELQILAPADGIVIAVGRLGSYGNRILIRHDDGSTSLLAHHAAQFVTVGQRVTQGQHIATMGNSGTKYVHSHQEYRDAAGNQLDPLKYLLSNVTTPTSTKPVIITPKEDEEEMKPVLLSNSKNLGMLINWAEGTWRGVTGAESAGHIANGYKYTRITDAQMIETKAHLTEKQL